MQELGSIEDTCSDISLSERRARLHEITADFQDGFKDNLLVTQPVSSVSRSKISAALDYYLWMNLSEFWKYEIFELKPDMLSHYSEAIAGLPNITPNGLILPKEENLHAYNALHKEVARYFCSLGLASHVSFIHSPINIRLVNGESNAQADARPRASVKYHTDLWAAEPSNALIVFLCIAGDYSASSIEFLEPETFPVDMVRPLDDYLEGVALVENGRKYNVNLDLGDLAICDPFLIHRTKKMKPGLRISIDFRFLPKVMIPSDEISTLDRLDSYLSFKDWERCGKDLLIATDKKLQKFNGKDVTSNTHSSGTWVCKLEKL